MATQQPILGARATRAAIGRTTRGARRPAFTLTEVLISIALVLILILGINQVFALASKAISGGQALSDNNRLARVAQNTFSEDLTNIEIDRAPFLIIRGQAAPAFRDKADQLRSQSYTPTTTALAAVDVAMRKYDLNNDAAETLIPRAILVGPRNHRTDQLFMFARGSYRRQTGNGTNYISDLTSTEAYISYGHLRQPTNVQLATSPGTAASREGIDLGPMPQGLNGTTARTPTDNPNNFYASQWILGRNVFLLRDPQQQGGVYNVTDNTGTAIDYVGRGATASSNQSRAPFSSASATVTNDQTAGDTTRQVQFSLCDVAGTSMERYRDVLMTQFAYPDPETPANQPASTRYIATWWQAMVFRYTGFPTPPRPFATDGIARTVPCFVPNCTQFIVEYAGDFLQQDPLTGVITNFADGAGGGTDGEVDFTVLNGQHKIRWYGYPRDTGGIAGITGQDQTKPDGHIYRPASGNPSRRPENVPDVIPLWATIRDVNPTVANAAAVTIKTDGFPFERGFGAGPPAKGFTNGLTAFQSIDPTNDNFDFASELVPLRAEYWCAWGPDTANFPRPKMIRITMSIDDPLNRIGAPQSYEYVFKLP